MDQTYGNTLRKYVTDPGSYTGSPGFAFARDQGLAALNSTNSRMRGSGNALAALVNYGTGVAQQDYGNEIDRLGKLSGQEEQYGLGQEQNQNTATANANQFALGNAANQNAAQRNTFDYALGNRNADNAAGANANTARANDQNFGLGMYNAGNNYSLGMTNAANTAQNNWWNYNLGGQANNNTAARDANNFTTAQGQNGINWFNANTNRGAQQSDAWNQDQNNQRAWYSINPRQRIAGQP